MQAAVAERKSVTYRHSNINNREKTSQYLSYCLPGLRSTDTPQQQALSHKVEKSKK